MVASVVCRMSNRHLTPQQLHDRLLAFGISVCKRLLALPRNFVIDHFASQILRSSTSPSAHYAEARDAESRRDFIHKMKMGLKELRETMTWLRYLSALSRPEDVDELIVECDELIAIHVSSLKSARN